MQAVRGDMRRLPDPLPSRLRVRERLPARADATLALHAPRSPAEAKRARERLVLEELLLMQVGLSAAQGLSGDGSRPRPSPRRLR